MDKNLLIVQARMGSTRLPGKVLKEVCGKPLLEILLGRLKRATKVNEVIVATSIKEADTAIVELCHRLRTAVFQGSEEDVLNRYYEAAKFFKGTTVIRITADCPLMDPALVDQIIGSFKDCDYVSNTLERSFPKGLDVEVFSFEALERANQEASDPYDREHVTPYIRTHFKTKNIRYHEDRSSDRWTVDTPEDFELIQKILEKLYPSTPNFTTADIFHLLSQNPSWPRINQGSGHLSAR